MTHPCTAPEGCTRERVAKGLCQTHYRRLQRTGTMEARPRGKPSLERRARAAGLTVEQAVTAGVAAVQAGKIGEPPR